MTERINGKATAEARANLAFVKYWGRADPKLNIPLNGSISMTLDGLVTTTTVAFENGLARDEVNLNGAKATERERARVERHLDRMRKMAGETRHARVASVNAFPKGAGLASSASAFAALTVAAAEALAMQKSREELSAIARLGSGSASRSLYEGFSEWVPGHDHDSSHAVAVAPKDHIDMVDVVALVETGEKKVGSSEGHDLTGSSPYMDARLARLPARLDKVRKAILAADFDTLGSESEHEAIEFHAVAMTSNPSLLYWMPETVRMLHAVRGWREDGVRVWMTLDAGPNPHLLIPRSDLPRLLKRLDAVGYGGERVLVAGPGDAPKVLAKHLF